MRLRGTALIVTIVVAGAAAVAALARPAPPQAAGWRQIIAEGFVQPSALASGWRAAVFTGFDRAEPADPAAAGWRVEGGALVGSDSEGRLRTVARVALPPGGLRVAWTVTPTVSPLNLNAVIGGVHRLDGYVLHVGGWGRPDHLAIGRPDGTILDDCTLGTPLAAGRSYRIELELEDGGLSCSIDGVRRLSARDPQPLPGSAQGGFGFEVLWNTVRIDDLAVWSRPAPPGPLDAADALAAAASWSRAAEAYRVAAQAPGIDPALAGMARVRGAGALMRAGYRDEAQAALNALVGAPSPVDALARCELLRALPPATPPEVIAAQVDALVRCRPERTVARLGLAAAGAALLAQLPAGDADAVVAAAATLRAWASALGIERVPEPLSDCAGRLNALGRHDLVVALFPDVPAACAQALLALGRYDEIHGRFPGLSWARFAAYGDAGRYAEGLAQLDEPFMRGRLARDGGIWPAEGASAYDRAAALAAAEGPAAALAAFPGESDAVAAVLLGDGRIAEALTVEGATPPVRALALIAGGQLVDAGRVMPAGDPGARELAACQAIARLAAGEAASDEAMGLASGFAWEYRVRWLEQRYDPVFTHHFAACVLPGLIAWRSAGQDPLPAWRQVAAEQSQRCGQRVDHRWLALTGASEPAELLNQPFQGAGHPRRELALVTAIRADLAGDPQAAAAWRAFLAAATGFDAAAAAWARLRIADLGG